MVGAARIERMVKFLVSLKVTLYFKGRSSHHHTNKL